VDTLFGLSNERFIFEEVHHAFKLCLLTFEKGGRTETFTAAFRINPREAVASDELDAFFHNPDAHVQISVPFVRKLSPDSLSVMEFRSETDARIAEKMLRWPLLGEELAGTWNLSLTAEFHMTNDSHLFKTQPGRGRLPLYEGKMIWQFEHQYAEPRYWVDEKEGRKTLLGKEKDTGQKLDYQTFRLGFRDIAASTNERSAIATIVPKNVFVGNTVPVHVPIEKDAPSLSELLALLAIFDSFVFDAFIRRKITSHLNFFYVNQMPVPRLTAKDATFAPIVRRAAQLVCTTPEFDDLAKEVGLGSHKKGVTDVAERAKLRAELDGLITHLYGLTEEEFAHILSAFPLVPDPVKLAAQNAYRDVERGLIR
jgi:hypothetical protein